MSDSSRRTFLVALGLAPATAISAESMLPSPERPGGLQVGQDASRERIAYALRRLADGIESRDVLVEQIDFQATLAADEIVRHTMTMKMIHAPKSYS